MVKIALFDLDWTLIAGNSGWLLMKAECAGGHVSPWQACLASGWMAAHRVGLVSMERGLLFAIAALEGKPAVEMEQRINALYRDRVCALYRPAARRAIAAHQAAGHRTALLTSASGPLARLVARDLGIEEAGAIDFEVDGRGRYTGRPLGEMSVGRGKLQHAHRYVTALGCTMAQCTYYTDSHADRAVLEAVGYPVAVCPDGRLRRLARARAWPILDWNGE